MANNAILSSAIFKPTRNGQTSTGAMTIDTAHYVPFASTAVVSSDSGAYFDAGSTMHVDASKFVIMYGSSAATGFFVRSDVSGFTGRDVFTETTDVGTGSTNLLKGLYLETTGESTAGLVYMAGPFETHMFKDTDGHINFEQTTGVGDSTPVYVTPIILP